MPPRRSAVRKRPRRIVRRRFTRKRRIPRALSSFKRYNIHQYKRSAHGQEIVTSDFDGLFLYAYTFAFAALPSVSDFTSLYDQFKITGIKHTIMLRSTNLSGLETNNSSYHPGMPYMYWVVDRDDNSAPLTLDELREYSAAKMFQFDTGRRTWSVYFKPNTLAAVDYLGSPNSRSIMFNKWIDMSNTGTQYYGLKIGIKMPVNGIISLPKAYFDVETTYYFTCRQAR